LSGCLVIQPKFRRRGERAELGGCVSGLLHPRRREAGEDVADRARREQRADQMTAATLVLLRRSLALLVVADRDVLGAVVVRELAAAQREHRRREREQRDEQFLGDRPDPLVLADALHGDAGARDRREHATVLHRQLRLGEGTLDLREQRHRLEQPCRAA